MRPIEFTPVKFNGCVGAIVSTIIIPERFVECPAMSNIVIVMLQTPSAIAVVLRNDQVELSPKLGEKDVLLLVLVIYTFFTPEPPSKAVPLIQI